MIIRITRTHCINYVKNWEKNAAYSTYQDLPYATYSWVNYKDSEKTGRAARSALHARGFSPTQPIFPAFGFLFLLSTVRYFCLHLFSFRIFVLEKLSLERLELYFFPISAFKLVLTFKTILWIIRSKLIAGERLIWKHRTLTVPVRDRENTVRTYTYTYFSSQEIRSYESDETFFI